MEYICIGKIVNTHGIKGEIRVKSDFKYKNKAFVKNNKLYIGKEKEEEIINTYRIHKDYDMLTLQNINDINDVLKYKNQLVYIKRDILEKEEYLDEDLIGFDIYIDNFVGKVEDIKLGIKYNFLSVSNKLIPNIPEFVKKIDFENKKIYIYNWEGLIDEN